jgi:O-antigen/teichoic acid export membrane protein
MTRNFLPKKYKIQEGYLKKLGRFGRYILGTGITSSVGKYFDQFLLGGINLGSVALFNASVRIINMIEIPVVSIANISYPKLANLNYEASTKDLARLYEKTVAATLAIILPVIIVVLTAPEFILILTAGKKYTDGAETLRILAALFFLLPFNVQFGNVCEIINKPQVSFIVNLITNLLSVLLNLYFINIYGTTGAAYVFAFTLLFIFVIGQTYLKIKIDVSIKNIVIQIALFYKSAFTIVIKKIKNRSLYA